MALREFESGVRHMAQADLVIRGGTVFDGRGGPPVQADVAITAGRISAVGPGLPPGAEEIDATRLIVAPGWVDIHTHYDGQITWDSRMTPSSTLGATTVVAGNCGVGFAPVRKGDEDTLVRLMEGVEDIPGAALHAGLKWNWESFASTWTRSTACRTTSTSRCRCRTARCASTSWAKRGANRDRRHAGRGRADAPPDRRGHPRRRAGLLHHAHHGPPHRRRRPDAHHRRRARGDGRRSPQASADAGSGVLQWVSDFGPTWTASSS
jgi:hypothetical protein